MSIGRSRTALFGGRFRFWPESLAPWLVRSRAWLSLVVLTPVAVGALFSPPHGDLASLLDFICGCLGWVLFFLGATFRWWATLYIGGRKSSELVQDGPYSITRNPLYLGTFLMSAAVTLFLQSLSLAAALAAVSFGYLLVTIMHEERHLGERYGPAFEAYCRRVPRFWPRWSSYHSPAVIDVRVRGLRAEVLRAARWTWIPVLCHLAAYLRCQEWWPHWFHIG